MLNIICQTKLANVLEEDRIKEISINSVIDCRVDLSLTEPLYRPKLIRGSCHRSMKGNLKEYYKVILIY